METEGSRTARQDESSRKERLKRYLFYALMLFAGVILIYIFVWFGTQLGLQG